MKCTHCGAEIQNPAAKFCPKCGNTLQAQTAQQPTPVAAEAAAPNTVSPISTIWPEWKVEKKPIGKGSFGAVYKAVRNDHNVESYAAIKVISIPSDSSEIDSLRSEGLDMNATRTYLEGIVNDFVSEIQLMESLKGIQNIVSVEDYKVVEKTGEIGWDIYIRMELLTPFNTYICDKTLTEEEVIKLGCDICTALEICGKRNIIHRDIKPENIFINDFGHFKLGDFGIARKMENLTGGLSQKGTYNYMAPEVANSSEYDARVDTYSLGIVLYRLLNGNRLPFLDTEKQLLNPNERRNAVERRIRGEMLPAPCNASPAMADLILRACAFDPAMRFASATEMKHALASVSNGTYQAAAANMDRTTSVRRAPADPDRTTSVRKAPAAPSKKETQAVSTFGTPKKKSKLPIVITVLVTIALLIGVGYYLVSSLTGGSSGEGSGKTSETMSAADREQAAIDAVIAEAEALAQNGDYEAAIAKIQEGLEDYPESEQLQEKSDDYSAKLTEEKIAAIISEAEELAAADDYEGALDKVQAALTTYPDSEALQEKVTEYSNALNEQTKQSVLAEAEGYAEAGDYEMAMTVIRNAQINAPDDADYIAAYQRYQESHQSGIKQAAISQADEYAKDGDYLSAMNTISNALFQIGNDETLLTLSTTYTDAYVADVLAQVEEHISNSQFDEAKDLLNDAAAAVPDNESIESKKDEVASVTLVSLSDLHVEKSDKYEVYVDQTITDSYGNNYTHNIVFFDASQNAYARYELNGTAQSFSGTIVASTQTGSGAEMNVGIFADGKEVFSLTDFTRREMKESFTINLTGVQTLEIKTSNSGDYSYGWLFFVDTEIVKNDIPAEYENWTQLNQLVVIDSSNYEGSVVLFKDSYGTLHNNKQFLDASHNAWVLYNLDNQYTTFTGSIATAPNTGSGASMTVLIYCDNELVYSQSGITKQNPSIEFTIDVSNVQTLKIVTSNEGEYGYGHVYIVDDCLK